MPSTIRLFIPMGESHSITDYENPYPHVYVHHEGGVVQVDAAPFGALCVHPAVYIRFDRLVVLPLYTVSHIESGLALATFTSEGIAELCADAAKDALDWGSFWAAVKDLDEDERLAWLTKHTEYYDKIVMIKRTFQARPEWVADMDEFIDVYYGEDD